MGNFFICKKFVNLHMEKSHKLSIWEQLAPIIIGVISIGLFVVIWWYGGTVFGYVFGMILSLFACMVLIVLSALIWLPIVWLIKNSTIKDILCAICLLCAIFGAYKFYCATNIYQFSSVVKTDFEICEEHGEHLKNKRFVTQFGKYYHKYSDCPGLKGKKIAQVDKIIATSSREMCPFCYQDKVFAGQSVMITPNSRLFHLHNNCYKLRKCYIREIEYDELGDIDIFLPCEECVSPKD